MLVMPIANVRLLRRAFERLKCLLFVKVRHA